MTKPWHDWFIVDALCDFITDDFEVSVFLTETSTRHTLVTKHKHFHDTTQTKLKSNSGRLISETNGAPIGLDMVAESAPIILREESDDEDAAVALADIPAIDEAASNSETRRPKRARSNTHGDADADSTAGHISGEQSNQVEVISDDDYADEDDDSLFVQSLARESPPAKRRKPAAAHIATEGEHDDKKKLAMDISYEGFSIYGRVLCLVVKRRDGGGAERTERDASVSTPTAGGSGSNRAKATSRGRGQAMMEDFIMSTQIPAGTDVS